MKKRYYLIVVLLLISLFIYFFYRTEKTVVNEIAILIISFETYAAIRETVITFLPLNEIIIYSLPGGLWVFCITLTSKPYYIQMNNRRIHGVFIPLIFCLSLEMFQLLNVTHGRFDIMDIWISVIFWTIASYSFNDKSDHQNVLMPVNRRTMICFATYGIVYLSHVLE